jgi:glycosyltransferase involved in cell wall biosynthesis
MASLDVKRRVHLLKAGLRLWREEGTANLVRRYRERRGLAVPRISRLEVFFAGLRPVRLPEAKDPEVSIVVPARTSRGILNTIVRNSRGVNFEIVREEREAKGRFVVLLEQGLVPAEGWLTAMLDVFARRPECGAVGAGGDYVHEVEECSGAVMVRNRGGPVWLQPAARVYRVGRSEERVVVRGRKLATKPAILVIDHQVPMFDRDAGSLFMTRFLSAAEASGYHVVFWPDNLLLGQYGVALQQEGIEVLHGRRSFEELVRTRAFSFTVVYRSTMAARYMPALQSARVPFGYIAVDLEHRRMAGELAESLKDRERRIVRAAECVGVHSAVEAELLRELGAEHVIELPLPLTHPHEASPGFERRRNLFFLGSTHPPNVDAIRHFAEQLFPRIRERLGDMQLTIAGNVSAAVRDLARSPSINLLGPVADLAQYFDANRVFVAPMRFGAGIKGKILEAMNHGIPVVTTPVGAEGIGLTHGETAMIAADDDAFVEHVLALYTNETLWRKVQSAGRELVQRAHSEEVFRKAVVRFLSCLGKQPETAAGS